MNPKSAATTALEQLPVEDLALLARHLRALNQATRRGVPPGEMELPAIPPEVAQRVRQAFDGFRYRSPY